MLIAALSAVALTTAACGKTVETGSRGVMIKDFGGGAQRTPLGQGWHGTFLPGEHIVTYPVTARTIRYSGDQRMVFQEQSALPLSGDVSITLQVIPSKVADVYIAYKQSLDELVENQIRTDVQAMITEEAELVPLEQFLGGGRQAILQRALAKVRRKWTPIGVNIIQLQWVGQLNLPQTIQNSVNARATAEAAVETARAQEIAANAEAAAQRARAQGASDAARIRGQMLLANPGILEEQRIAKWRGICPMTGGGNCIVGAAVLAPTAN